MIKPIGNRVLVEPIAIDVPGRSSGIVLPDETKPSQDRGTVVALGHNVEGIEIGTVVWYGKYSGDEIELNKVKYRMVDVVDLLAYEPQKEASEVV